MSLSGTDDLLKPAVEVGRGVSSFLPGPIGKIAGAGFEVFGGEMQADAEIKRFRTEAGIDLYKAQKYSRHAREKLKRLDNISSGNLARYGVQIAAGGVGGIVGAMAGGLVGMPWLGGIAGSIGVGYVAGNIYEGAIEKHEQDVVNLAADGYRKRQQGQALGREEAFATLMAALPERVQKKYEDILKRKAGTHDFAQALQTKEGLRAIRAMMGDARLEGMLHHFVSIPPVRGRHIADQYAELINSGALDARAIVLDPTTIGPVAERYRQEQMINASVVAPDGDQVTSQAQLPTPQRAVEKNL